MRNFYEKVLGISNILKAKGFEGYSEKLEDAIYGGSTSGEILVEIGAALSNLENSYDYNKLEDSFQEEIKLCLEKVNVSLEKSGHRIN